MARIGLEVPRSVLVNNLKDGLEFTGKIGFPIIIRPSFTLVVPAEASPTTAKR